MIAVLKARPGFSFEKRPANWWPHISGPQRSGKASCRFDCWSFFVR